MNELETELRLRAWLDEQAELVVPGELRHRIAAIPVETRQPWRQLIGLPSGAGWSAWLAGRRWVWIVVLGGLLAALAAGAALVGTSQSQRLVIVPTTTSPRPSPTPPAAGPCAAGALAAAGGSAAPDTALTVQGPTDALVAFSHPDWPYEVWTAGGGASGARVEAKTILGPSQLSDPGGWGLDVLGWTPDGATLLVSTGSWFATGPADVCGNLYLLRADGSALTRLTDNHPGIMAVGGSLSPDGRSVAFVERGFRPQPGTSGSWTAADALMVSDASGASTMLDPIVPCSGAQLERPGLTWSPDGRQLALPCDASIVVYSVPGGHPTTLRMPADTVVAALAWSPDGRRILVAAPNAGEPQDKLTVLSFDPAGGAATVVSRTTESHEWAIGFPAEAFSPDGRWLVATGYPPGYSPGCDCHSLLYAMDVASGQLRPVPATTDVGPEVHWYPDGQSFVFHEPANPLIRVSIRDLSETAVGTIPYAYSAWHWLGP